MSKPATTDQTGSTPPWPDCVELGEWTPIPAPLPESFRLALKKVDEQEARTIKERRVLAFHTVGCTGCHADQEATTRVAGAMVAQAGDRAGTPVSFLYHLGDVVYKHDKDTAGAPAPPPDEHTDFAQLYDTQFHAPYAAYRQPIFAIAGNHDGKDRHPDGPARKSAIQHFLKNFCGLQPYPYWLLDTPLAHLIGLYANVNNAGQLDNPQSDARPQYDWLVQTLRDIQAAADGKAVLLAVHYPPYSAAVNFVERGDPNLGPTPRPPGKTLEPLGVLLQRAFRDSGQYPDAVFSAHAHLYQRLTYTHADGRQIPYLVVGAGGHAPVEKLSRPCLKKDQDAAPPEARPSVVYPPGLSLPAGDRLQLAAYNDTDFGFVRVTLDAGKHSLTGEYFTVPPLTALPALADSFTLDLRTHALR